MRFIGSILPAVAAICLAASAFAHHSFSAEFDVGRPVELTGTVRDIEWTNPHAWLHLDVTGAEGEVRTWAVEMLGVNALARGGLSSRTLKAGDRLIITGFGARDGTNTANASSVTRADTGEALWVSEPADRN
jgi:hypothetical protein